MESRDARYEAKYGREALRATWRRREKLRTERYRARHGTEALGAMWSAKARLRPTKVATPVACDRCGEPFQRMGYQLYCDPCRHRPCEWCSTPFLHANPHDINTRTCSRSCAAHVVAFGRYGPPIERRIGKACRIQVTDCTVCGQAFTQHGASKKFCSPECRQTNKRDWIRDYQRRTHKTAIRYWTIAPTPEAEALARDYFELRQTVRKVLHG